MSDELRRLETLERLVRQLARDVAELRAEVRGRAASPHEASPHEAERMAAVPDDPPVPAASPVPPPMAAQPSVDWGGVPVSRERRARAAGDVERLVGRYGTIALAVLTIVMGLGVFLRWAVEHVQLSDTMRVVLGGIGAVAIGVFGWRLRARGHRQYGDTLVGLSLALVHVVAWGAGPYLRVVPDGVALAIAASASVLLATAAWLEREQPLFAAGLGGAFLAPFVTTRSAGSPEALLTYGVPLVVTATLALGRGDWRVARRILAMGTLLFAGAALAALPDDVAWQRLAEAPAFTLGAAALAQLAMRELHRRALAYDHLASTLVVLGAVASHAPPVEVAAAFGLVGALVAAAASRGEGDSSGGTFELAVSGTGTFSVGAMTSEPVPWVGAVGFPVAFLGVALFAMADPVSVTGALVALALAALAAAFAVAEWRGTAVRRGAHVAAAGFALVIALLLGAHDRLELLACALAAAGVALAVLGARSLTPLALVPGLLAITLATTMAAMALALRPAWSYVPFATWASLAAAVVVAGWWGVARATARLVASCPRPAGLPIRRTDDVAVLAAMTWVVAFGWGHQELRHAFSPALATFLLVAYYASSGVLTIGIGRARGSAPARRVGLALAVLAALKAIVQASTITAIGLRVGSYLLVGGFLLGVAWWYRSGEGESSRDDDLPAPPAPDVPPRAHDVPPGTPGDVSVAAPGGGRDGTMATDALAPARTL